MLVKPVIAGEADLSVDQRVARLIRALLSKKGITYKSFAEKCELPYRTVQNYLAEKARMPADFVAKACDILGVEADYLLFNGVDLGRTALADAVAIALAELLPQIELVDFKPRFRTKTLDHHDNDVAEASLRAATISISARIRDEYISIRLDELRVLGAGSVSPGDASHDAFLMQRFDKIDGRSRTLSRRQT